VLQIPNVGDEQFDFVAQQAITQTTPVIDQQMDADPWPGACHTSECLGYQPSRGIRTAAQQQLTGFEVGQLNNRILQRAATGEQALSVLEYQLPMRREAYTPAMAIKQAAVEAGLKCLNASAQRWLTEVDGFSGAGKIAVLGQG
jgi:hypothetical protein